MRIVVEFEVGTFSELFKSKHILVRVLTRQIWSLLRHCCYFITSWCLKHRRFFTKSTLLPSHRSCYLLPRFMGFSFSKPTCWVLFIAFLNADFRTTIKVFLWVSSLLSHIYPLLCINYFRISVYRQRSLVITDLAHWAFDFNISIWC